MAPRIFNLNMVINYQHTFVLHYYLTYLNITKNVKLNETPKLNYTNIYIFTNLTECPTENVKTKGNAPDIVYSLLESSFQLFNFQSFEKLFSWCQSWHISLSKPLSYILLFIKSQKCTRGNLLITTKQCS